MDNLAKTVASRLGLEENMPPTPLDSPKREASPQVKKPLSMATELVYIDSATGVRDPYNAASVPIYQTATFKQNSATQMGEYDYTRSGNPTRSQLERHLAKIMKAKRALVVTSGMGAMDVITRLLKAGDEVIAGDDLYGGTNRLLKYLSTHGGITVHHVDTTKTESVIPFLNEKTALVLLETPTNPLIKICDITAISTLVHQKCPNGVVVVDNTMMSPMLMNPLDLGADIVYESGTKYLSGHHDLMAGVLAVNSEDLGEKLFFTINATGCGLSPFDSWLLLRGVKTLGIRMEKQQANAERIAAYLEDRGFKVHYPGLRSHPQYDLHARLARGPGAVLSFETGSTGISEKIVEGTKIHGISVSFGCINSLISMPCRMSHASINEQTRKERGLPEDLIRLAVGIEDVEDLIEDLEGAIRGAYEGSGLVPGQQEA
ncbi:cystathionine beta-lyase [Saitoella coloradoensis]